jgi:iron complex transport system substrate-binding protein
MTLRRSLVIVAALLWTGAALADPPARRAHFYRPDTPSPAQPYKRIVSLAPVVTETLFLLGAGDRVVGVTRYCDRPIEARSLPAVGGFVDPQLEVIAALKPDLVIAMPSLGQRRILDRLRDRGVAVLVGFGDRADEVQDLVTTLGATLHAKKPAADLLARQARALAALDGALKGEPRVIVLVATRPLVAAGPSTFVDDSLLRLGARRALADTSPQWPTLSWEALVEAAPDVIVVAEGPAARTRLFKELQARWPAKRARPRVVAHDESILMRPGPTLHEDVAVLSRLVEGGR